MNEELSLQDNPKAQDYKRLALSHWAKYLPKMTAGLAKEGKLKAAAEAAALQTLTAERQIREELLKKNPPPESDFLKKVQHLEWAKKTAEEMVLQEWILLPAEKEVTERDLSETFRTQVEPEPTM